MIKKIVHFFSRNFVKGFFFKLKTKILGENAWGRGVFFGRSFPWEQEFSIGGGVFHGGSFPWGEEHSMGGFFRGGRFPWREFSTGGSFYVVLERVLRWGVHLDASSADTVGNVC